MEFIKRGNMPEEIVKKYEGLIPEEIIIIWKEHGICEFLDGYLRIINPNEYNALVKDTYFRGKDAIPIIVTAFGDIITWEKGQYVGFINYKNGVYDILIKNISNFFRCLEDNYFINKFFNLTLYKSACAKLGRLKLDECFGFVPLLGLGGSERVDNLKIVKTREHIELITQLVGRIE